MSDPSKALVPSTSTPVPDVDTVAAQITTPNNFEGRRRSSRASHRQSHSAFRHRTQSTPPSYLFFGFSTLQPISISFTSSGLVVMNGSPNNNMGQGFGQGQGYIPNGFQSQPNNYPQLTSSGGGFQQQQPNNTGYNQGHGGQGHYYDPRQQMQTPNQNHNHFHGSSSNFFFMGSGSFNVHPPQGQGQGFNMQQRQQHQINPPNNYGHSQGNYFQPQNGYGHHSQQISGTTIRPTDYSPPAQSGGVAYLPSASNLRRNGSLASLDTTSLDEFFASQFSQK